MQIDPYCQRRTCSLVKVLSSDIRVMAIFAGVREIWGVKQESGRLRCRFSYLLLAIFSESSSPRLKSTTHSICVKLLHKHDKLAQCCRAFTLALAKLSCKFLVADRVGRVNLHQCTKFHQNRSNGRGDIAFNGFKHGGRLPSWIFWRRNQNTWRSLSPCKIWLELMR